MSDVRIYRVCIDLMLGDDLEINDTTGGICRSGTAVSRRPASNIHASVNLLVPNFLLSLDTQTKAKKKELPMQLRILQLLLCVL